MTIRALGRRLSLGPLAQIVHARPRPVDAGLALLYAGVFLGFTVIQLGVNVLDLPWVGRSGPALGLLGVQPTIVLFSRATVGLMLVCAVALAWWRSRAELTFLVIGAVAVVQVAVREPIRYWDIAMPIALFAAAAYASRRFARAALAVVILGYVGAWAVDVDLLGRLAHLPDPIDVLSGPRGATFAVLFALLVLVWAAGDQVRAARERVERDLERAEQIAREQEARARIGTLAERQRIARELHDVVAHGLAVMIVQADGARYAAAEHPEAPREALATIASAGRESLGEMRRLLAVLREDPDPGDPAPEPGLASLPTLVERFRESGLDVDYTEEAPVQPVPPAVGLTAYRVVQEALTNVLHHAGPTHVEVRLAFRPDVLDLVVGNEPGATPPHPSGSRRGLGLRGMRERVVLLDGTMTAGPTPKGGFRVRAEIPVRAPMADPEPPAPQDGRGRAPSSDPDASRGGA